MGKSLDREAAVVLGEGQGGIGSTLSRGRIRPDSPVTVVAVPSQWTRPLVMGRKGEGAAAKDEAV
ncbi:hypothetical protein E2562_003653 [Oryza meyeriana var. granulata]|uniref:Uncharacterized protein n=1 Tax=Oryza meyeriana var. granulata TaxID=110450 RepID=A0A6G1C3F9_9ORYZ|nr:hypothetical protein E2562_003653 [Oryza meyeriana var. granulata]